MSWSIGTSAPNPPQSPGVLVCCMPTHIGHSLRKTSLDLESHVRLGAHALNFFTGLLLSFSSIVQTHFHVSPLSHMGLSFDHSPLA